MKYQQWNLRSQDPRDTGALMAAGFSPLCAAVLCARGLDDPGQAEAFLRGGAGELHDPFLLRDMDAAAARVARALEDGEAIAVYGDYDVDGITSTTLLTEFLRSRGGRVTAYIPDRIEEGYGLNREAEARLRSSGVTLIVTVDCGITAVEEVEYARELGMDVVITDHHRCKGELPRAAAVVDPRRPDCAYPFEELAGVGVALKLILALTPPAEREAVFARYADLAAVGTVADVMALTGENRTIVTRGLEALSRTNRPGLAALLREAGAQGKPVTAVTVGYTLAPRINAAGRLEQAEAALELLLTEDPRRADALAEYLCQLNRTRQAIELEIFEACVERIGQDPDLARPCVVMAGEGWHQGVVGIVASRLAEKYACPAFMICLDQGRGKGSCRSFGGFSLFTALESCADLLEGFGGHEMAAGFTILEENIPAFRARMAALIQDYTQGQPMTASLDIDVGLEDGACLTVEGVESLECLEPHGLGNPKPVFALTGLTVVSCADVGGGRHLKLRLRQGEGQFDAIFFSATAAAAGVTPGCRVDVAFTPQINDFRGSRTVQLQLCDLRPAPTRAQAERALLAKVFHGEHLTAREAREALPAREDFAAVWRFLKRSSAAGPVEASPGHLARHIGRGGAAQPTYTRAMVCLKVMDERGLIRVERRGGCLRIDLCQVERKVDLDQSPVLRRLKEMSRPG